MADLDPPPDPTEAWPTADPTEAWPAAARRWFAAAPIVLLGVFTLMLWRPRLRPLGSWLLAESHPVELLTFVFLLIAGLIALRLAFARRRAGAPPWEVGFFVLFGLGLLATAMEEIAWGQSLIGFATPQWAVGSNEQQEFTLHNLKGMHGHNVFLRMAFGVGGLVAIALGRTRRFSRLAAPAALFPWFAVVTAFCILDLAEDFASPGPRVHWMFLRLAELIEMFIGFGALAYVWACARRRSLPDPAPPA